MHRRRIAWGAVLAAVGVLGVPAPGATHACGAPMEVPVGRRSRVDVPVTVADVPVVGVEIAVPSGYRLEDVRPVPGWRAEKTADSVRFTDGRMEPYSCAPFSLLGVATEQATLRFPVTLRLADGTTAPYTSEEDADHDGAQIVYAGTAPTDDPDAPTDGAGSGWVLVGGGAVVAVVGLIGAAWLLARRAARTPG